MSHKQENKFFFSRFGGAKATGSCEKPLGGFLMLRRFGFQSHVYSFRRQLTPGWEICLCGNGLSPSKSEHLHWLHCFALSQDLFLVIIKCETPLSWERKEESSICLLRLKIIWSVTMGLLGTWSLDGKQSCLLRVYTCTSVLVYAERKQPKMGMSPSTWLNICKFWIIGKLRISTNCPKE